MYHQISSVFWAKMDDKDLLILSNSFHGENLIAFEPDILMCSRKIYEKFKSKFIFKSKGKMQVMLFD